MEKLKYIHTTFLQVGAHIVFSHNTQSAEVGHHGEYKARIKKKKEKENKIFN